MADIIQLGWPVLGREMAQQQQIQNAYTNQCYFNNTDAYITNTTTTGATISSEQFQSMLNQMNSIGQQEPAKKKKAPSKTGKILIDLRREIDEWHGDILMRAA